MRQIKRSNCDDTLNKKNKKKITYMQMSLHKSKIEYKTEQL